MATNPSNGKTLQLESSVKEWLLDADPAIRWQVMQDLLGASADEVAAERAKVATEGWGAQLLAQQGEDGAWGGVAWNHGFDSTMHVLTLLQLFGLDPTSFQARHAVEVVQEKVVWEWWNTRYFEGEVEPCINGQVVAAAAYFGQNVSSLITRLLGEQMTDGGWNCDQENGSVRGSFNTTICVLEGLLEYELAFGKTPELTLARQRGEDYLLERHLFRRKTTGEPITEDRDGKVDWTTFAFPNWWHYDILRGLDYLRQAGIKPDERMKEALEVVESKRTSDGLWLLDKSYPGTMLVELGESEGQPGRWNTLRALRVMRWYHNGK